jgi:hypothetical protein
MPADPLAAESLVEKPVLHDYRELPPGRGEHMDE